MGFLQALGGEMAGRLARKWMPTGEEDYRNELMKIHQERFQAERKGLQGLDEPIYQQGDPLGIGSRVQDGEMREPYKSKITPRMVKDYNLQPEEFDKRSLEALGIRPQPRREPREQYRLYETPEGYEDLPRGSQIPPGYKPYDKPSSFYNPFAPPPLLPGQRGIGEGKVSVGEEGAVEGFPPPEEHEGETGTDENTGKRYRSNGREWVEIE